jgi:hypothetical protein
MGKRPLELEGELPPGSTEPWTEGELAFMLGGFLAFDEEQLMVIRAGAGMMRFG